MRAFGLFLLVGGNGRGQRPHCAVGLIHHSLDAAEDVGSALGEHGWPRRRRVGRLPTALGDGVAFTASADDNGRPLDGRCDVVLAGVTPAARFWTLTLYNPDGELVANSIKRYGFTSQEIVRHADGSFEIVVAPRANAGNWLPTGGVERYALSLRLYDTAVGVSTKAGREVPMPAVNVRGCP